MVLVTSLLRQFRTGNIIRSTRACLAQTPFAATLATCLPRGEQLIGQRLSADGTLLVQLYDEGGVATYRLTLQQLRAGGQELPLRDVVFCDLAPAGQALVPGRPFGMLEASDGRRLTLVSPVGGEVLTVNTRVLQRPQLLQRGNGAGAAAGAVAGADGREAQEEPPWLIEIDPLTGAAEAADAPEWRALSVAVPEHTS